MILHKTHKTEEITELEDSYEIAEKGKLIDADELIEVFADEIHRIWMGWAEDLMDKEELSEERVDRWIDCLVDYKKLPEDVKEKDREIADFILLMLFQKFPKLTEVFIQKEKENDADTTGKDNRGCEEGAVSGARKGDGIEDQEDSGDILQAIETR